MLRIKCLQKYFIFYIFFCAIHGIGFSQDYNEKGDYRLIHSTYTGSLIAGIDIVKWKESQNLTEFKVSSRRGMKPMIKEYSLYSTDGQIKLELGIYPTIPEAEHLTLDMLNTYVNVQFQEWGNPPVGDSAWYINSIEKPEGIVFIRRNVVVFLYRDTYQGSLKLLDLAKTIDNALTEGAEYVKISQEIKPPVIHSAVLSKTVLISPEWITLTVEAEDPEGYNLLYSTNFDPFTYESNVFKFYCNSSYPIVLGEKGNDSKIIIKAWVVNEMNLFSSVTELTMNF
jgi:hypothetical protein